MFRSDANFYLRSLPFVAAILSSLLALYLFPDTADAIYNYIMNTNPEEDFSTNGWYLYALVIPFCIAGLSRIKNNWCFMIALAIFPPILALSYWLWEILAWVMIAISFAWLMIITTHNTELNVAIVAIGSYALCRVIGCFGEGMLLAIGDVGFIVILGGYMLVTSIIDTFKYDNRFIPSGTAILYMLLMMVIVLVLSNFEGKNSTRAYLPSEQNTTTTTTYYCIASSTVNVRSNASASASVVGKLNRGQAVQVYEYGETFSKIAFKHTNGETAWVSSNYISTTKPAAIPSTSSNSTKKTNTSTTTTNTSNYKIYVTPSTATIKVTINGKENIWPVKNGVASKNIPHGTYKCQITADGYYSYENNITVSNSQKEKHIELVKKHNASSTQSSSSHSSSKSTSSAQSSPTSIPTRGVHNSHEYVDLGLSVKWATCNVGASKPQDCGGYYAYGETTKKNNYTWDTYKHGKGSSKLYKYNSDSRLGNVDRKKVLDAIDDAATANWGGNWRMPSKAEIEELITKCNWEWTTINGTRGYKVISKSNGNYIFLPGYSYYSFSSRADSSPYGNYMSRTLHSDNLNVYKLGFNPGGKPMCNSYSRVYGYTIRPVCK